MANDFFDVVTLIFAIALVAMGIVQMRKPLSTGSPFRGPSVPDTRPGAVRVMGYLLVVGGLLFLGLFVAGVSDVLHLSA
jgi:formate hydrogenlyase subunit 4